MKTKENKALRINAMRLSYVLRSLAFEDEENGIEETEEEWQVSCYNNLMKCEMEDYLYSIAEWLKEVEDETMKERLTGLLIALIEFRFDYFTAEG